MLKQVLIAGIGGFFGTILRTLTYQLMKGNPTFISTFIINIFGSLFIGLVIGLSINHSGLNNHWKLFLATGICGGFTTFSAFSMENMQLIQQEKYGLAILYIVSSFVLGIAASFFGYKITCN